MPASGLDRQKQRWSIIEALTGSTADLANILRLS
jgi:hypothetical protein